MVLQNVTCTIRAGEKIGIVGRTGSGENNWEEEEEEEEKEEEEEEEEKVEGKQKEE